MIGAVPTTAPVRTAANRVIQGVLLVAGAGLLEFSAGAERIAFYWTPLIIGTIYLLAAIVESRACTSSPSVSRGWPRRCCVRAGSPSARWDSR